MEIEALNGLHENIAQDAFGTDHGLVKCEECEREQEAIHSVCLRTGWPKCCGKTMALEASKTSGE